MELLIVARHGESELSAAGLCNGDPSLPVGLTQAGEEQARALGRALAGDELDLCVATEFPRVQATVDLALLGRDVPRTVAPELNDPLYGVYEGAPLEVYRAWAGAHGPEDAPPGGGESRTQIARRYVAGFRAVLARPEACVLVVAHSLTLRYLLDAAAGASPRPRVELVPYAEPFRLSAAELEGAIAVLGAWAAAPAW